MNSVAYLRLLPFVNSYVVLFGTNKYSAFVVSFFHDEVVAGDSLFVANIDIRYSGGRDIDFGRMCCLFMDICCQDRFSVNNSILSDQVDLQAKTLEFLNKHVEAFRN